jgi:hypothetical protein
LCARNKRERHQADGKKRFHGLAVLVE